MKRRQLITVAFALAALTFMAALVSESAMAAEKRILMVLWKGETNAERAFKEKLAQLGYQVTYTIVDAEQNRGTLAQRLREIELKLNKSNFDLIYTYGTVGTKVLLEIAKESVPVVFNIVYDPVGGELVQSLDKPGRGVTGVTNGVPIADQFAQFQKLAPIKHLGVLFNARETNSNILERDVAAWAAGNNVKFTSLRVSNDQEILNRTLEEIRSGSTQIDALYAGADNYLASKAKEIQEKIGDKIHLFGGTQTYIWSKWLGAYTPLVTDMGITAAEQADKIFKGADASTLPVILPAPKLFSHEQALQHFGITPPAGTQVEKEKAPAS